MKFPIIDSHHHLWDRKAVPQPWLTDPILEPINRDYNFDDYLATFEPQTINGTIAVQALPSLQDSQWLLQEAATIDALLGVVGWVDFTEDTAPQLLNLRRSPGGHKLVGVRFMAQAFESADEILDPKYATGIEQYGQESLPLDIVCRHYQIASVIELARRYPTLEIVLNHFGKPALQTRDLSQWESEIAQIGELPNITVKLSGLATESDWTQVNSTQLAQVITYTLQHIPTSRLCYGSDWPVSSLAISNQDWLAMVLKAIAHLPTQNQQEILFSTALRLYQIND